MTLTDKATKNRKPHWEWQLACDVTMHHVLISWWTDFE